MINGYSVYDMSDRHSSKMKSDNRIIFLKPMEGKNALSSTGNIDNRLFTGENKLHAIFDNNSGMWSMKYEVGAIPGGLQQRFTSFSELLDFVKGYFRSRNIEVVDVAE